MEQKLLPQWTETHPSDYLLMKKYHDSHIKKERIISLSWNLHTGEMNAETNFGNKITGKRLY